MSLFPIIRAFRVNCWHLAKTCFSKVFNLMSEGSKQKIDCRRSYMAFYVLSDNRGITLSDWRLSSKCWHVEVAHMVFYRLLSIFFLRVTLMCVVTFGLTVVTKLDLLVNNGINLVLGKMRNCVMQNTNGKMRNEKNAEQWWFVHTSGQVERV